MKLLEVLEDKGYSYKIVGDTVIVIHDDNVDLDDVKTINTEIVFKNNGYTIMKKLKRSNKCKGFYFFLFKSLSFMYLEKVPAAVRRQTVNPASPSRNPAFRK